MGLAEYFYPLAVDQSLRQQLAVFISSPKLVTLQQEEMDGFKIVGQSVSTGTLSNEEILGKLERFASHGKVFSDKKTLPDEVFGDVVASFGDLMTRIMRSHGNETERECLSSAITGCGVWHIIKLVRILCKKRHSIACKNKDNISRTALNVFQATECSSLPHIKEYLEEFMVVRKESLLFELIKANPELSSNVRTEKDFSLYSLNQEEDVFLIKADLFNNLTFNVCVSEILSLYKIKSQNDLIRLEILSRLSTSEKTAVKFSKIYTKKSDEILLTFDFSNQSSAILEDFIYSKILSIIGKPGKQDNCNFFMVYQYYDLLTRNTSSSAVIAALIRSQVAKVKNNRVFFLLEEVDLLVRHGKIGKAYYKMRDLHEYCEEKNTTINKSAYVYIMMKELFILLWANAAVAPSTDEDSSYFSFPTHSAWPRYYKEEFKRLEWIVERGANLYMVEEKVSMDSLDEIAHNLHDKLEGLVTEAPTSQSIPRVQGS
jgi:hypothetical protein